MNTTELQAYIASLELAYAPEFVPFTKAVGPLPASLDGLSINWRITLVGSKSGSALTTSYSQGIAYAPGYKQGMRSTLYNYEALSNVCEHGHYIDPDKPYCKPVKILPPALVDVLHAVVLDAQALDADSFELWAEECGFDSDSRKAEVIFNACLENGRALRALIGPAALDELHDLFADY